MLLCIDPGVATAVRSGSFGKPQALWYLTMHPDQAARCLGNCSRRQVASCKHSAQKRTGYLCHCPGATANMHAAIPCTELYSALELRITGPVSALENHALRCPLSKQVQRHDPHVCRPWSGTRTHCSQYGSGQVWGREEGWGIYAAPGSAGCLGGCAVLEGAAGGREHAG